MNRSLLTAAMRRRLVGGCCLVLWCLGAGADLLPDFLKKVTLHSEIWREQEQYVALGPQGDKDRQYPPNAQPVTLDIGDVRDALRSLQLWQEGGLLRSEQASPLFTKGQAEALGQFVTEALAKAKANEDVLFNVRGYGSVALDTLKEREWTSGRAFYADGKLNLIIGSFKVKKDRGVKNAEAAYGILDNYSDVYFDPGSRDTKSSRMPGKIVATAGVAFAGGEQGGRPDWVIIEVSKAALAFREGLIPEEDKRRENSARQEAAKLTLERRQMREEMARLRQELKDLKAGGSSARSVEDRLATLQELRNKDLISDDEYRRRRSEILGDI